MAGAAASRGPAPRPWESQPGRPAAPATQPGRRRLWARSPAPAPLIDIIGVWSQRRVCSRRLAGSEHGADDREGEIVLNAQRGAAAWRSRRGIDARRAIKIRTHSGQTAFKKAASRLKPKIKPAHAPWFFKLGTLHGLFYATSGCSVLHTPGRRKL